jgi:hypothetical protein
MNINIPVSHPKLIVAGAKPNSTQILQGQIAINLTDRKIYTIDQNNNVQQLGVAPADLATVALTGSYNDLSDKPNFGNYVLPPASTSVLGGVIVKTGLAVDSNGDLTNTGVLTVNSRAGAVTLTATDVGLPTDLLSGASGTVATKYLPAALTGGLSNQGNWNASTNSPTLANGGIGPSGTQLANGSFYVVAEAGTTSLDGIASWTIGDLALVSNNVWTRIANSGTTVLSVNGKTGAVVLTASDISGLATVATSGSFNDLLNKPTPYSLPIATTSSLGGVILQTTAQQAGNPSSGTLATVATTGSYDDLLNLPTNPDVARLPVNVQGNPNIINEVFYDFAQAAQFPHNFAGSVCTAKLVSGTTATVTIWQYNSVNPNGQQVGTISINTSSGNTFSSTQQATTFAIGDELSYRCDTNIARLTVNLLGTWQ